MPNKRKRVLLVLLGAVVLAATSYFADYALERKRQNERDAQLARQIEQAKTRLAEERHAQQQTARVLRDPGPSQWLQQGRAPLLAALLQWKPRVVVLPPSNVEDQPGLDLTARVAFARALAANLSSDARVPDPGFVLYALGEPRVMDESGARLALGNVQPESLVTGTVTLQGRQIVLKLQRVNPPRRERPAYETRIDVDVLYPEQALVRVAPDAMRALGFDVVAPQPAVPATPPELDLPPSPLAALQGSDPLTGIWLQELFGVLHSRAYDADPRARERLFEKSLWSLSRLSADSADRAVLEARALAYLGRRSPALKAVANTRNAETHALTSFLNADLRDLKTVLPEIRRPVARLIAELELLAMRQIANDLSPEAYRIEAARVIQSVPQPWQPLVAFYAYSFNAWDYPSPLHVKQVLDRDFPVPGYDAKHLVVGNAALGATPYDPKLQAGMDLSSLIHVRKWREEHIAQLCCSAPHDRGYGPAVTDYLDLLENAADSFIVGRLVFQREVQGNREQVLSLIRLYDELLFGGGHPGVLAQKAKASNLAENQPNDEETYEATRKVLAWTPYQSMSTGWALGEWGASTFRIGPSRGYRGDRRLLAPPPMEEPLARDVPPRAAFLVELASDSRADMSLTVRKNVVLQACTLSMYDFTPCSWYTEIAAEQPAADDDTRLDAAIGGRFAGYPQPALTKASALRNAGRTAEAESVLREALKSASAQELYAELGALLRDAGEFEGSVKAYLSYPELQRQQSNTVMLSNYLAQAAGPLLRRGAGEIALPLVAAAAAYHDGSQANLQSQMALALWQKDGTRAMRLLRSVYQRYPNPKTLGQLSSLMFLVGEQEAAWDALKPIAEPALDFSADAAALVGLRRLRAAPSRALTWFQSNRLPFDYNIIAAFRLFALDRSAGSLARFFEVERNIRLNDPSYAQDRNLAAPNVTPADPASIALQASALGYRDLLARDYAGAVAAFAPMLAPFERSGEATGFSGADNFWSMLPYAAYAAAKGGRRDRLDAIVSRLGSVPEFESLLVRAELAALAGNSEEALRELRAAQARISLGGQPRLVPQEYALTQVAEWLSRDTGDSSYAAFATAYARAYQLYEPWAAWCYAFEARHTRDAQARVRAAAMALWLDPDSQRLGEVPPGTRASAAAFLKKNPPFRTPARGRREERL